MTEFRYKRLFRGLYTLLIAVCAMILTTSCGERRGSNKAERNAVKKGNEAFHSSKFDKAVELYDEAIEANSGSEKAKFNLGLATLLSPSADSVALARANQYLADLAQHALDPEVAENAIYTMSNASVYLGDELKKQSESEQDQGMAQQLSQKATQYYKQAISGYEELLRRKPGDLRVTQNLRVTQLKLPPEDDGGGGGGQDQNQDQNEQNEDQKDQQKQQQQQQQQPQPQADALNALEKREAQTRKKQVQPVQGRQQTEKPW